VSIMLMAILNAVLYQIPAKPHKNRGWMQLSQIIKRSTNFRTLCAERGTFERIYCQVCIDSLSLQPQELRSVSPHRH
jgi:hypothetical protein